MNWITNLNILFVNKAALREHLTTLAFHWLLIIEANFSPALVTLALRPLRRFYLQLSTFN